MTQLYWTAEPWSSVAVLWVYTHKRTCSFFLRKLEGCQLLEKTSGPCFVTHLVVIKDFFSCH